MLNIIGFERRCRETPALDPEPLPRKYKPPDGFMAERLEPVATEWGDIESDWDSALASSRTSTSSPRDRRAVVTDRSIFGLRG